MTSTQWAGLAVDLGASSGRVVFGKCDGKTLVTQEVHRFENVSVRVLDTLHWDIVGLYHHVLTGLRRAHRAVSESRGVIRSLGIDSWGVDFGLLDSHGHLLGDPVCYRDARTAGMMDAVFETIPADDIFRQTGIQFLSLNTIYQLAAMRQRNHPFLKHAATLLLIPDLLNYFLTGEKRSEFTISTTTQLFNPAAGDWAWELIDALKFPKTLFTPVIQPGSRIGGLLKSVTEDTGGLTLDVIAVGSHDTASAVAAVPASTSHFAYISCGTWSLLGTEINTPVITPRVRELNFTNEGGVNATWRLLKNIMGLWLLQEIRREWQRQGRTVSWDDITRLTESAEPFTAFIDPDDAAFFPPGDMPRRVRDYCKKTGQPVPETDGALLRCVTESLAMTYRRNLERLDELTDTPVDALHIVGGGIQNHLLMQFTAAAAGRPVIAGPKEASALGNLAVQMIAAGVVSDLSQARELIAASFPPVIYNPVDTRAWDDAYDTYMRVTGA